MGFRSTRSLGQRLAGAFRALVVSFTLSLVGTAVDFAIFVLSGGLILLTDLLHWTVDTVLEGVLLLVLYLASRLSRKFPWSLVILEGVAVSLGTITVLVVYGYFFVDYLIAIAKSGTPSYVGYLPLVATVAGAAITCTVFLIERRSYLKYRVELLSFDTTHALVDLVASVVASAGVVITTVTRSYVTELLFTFVLMMFVVHSLLEVFKDNIKAIAASNRVPEVESHVVVRLSELNSEKVRVRSVAVRKFGSLMVAEVSVDVNPRVSVLELHRLRERIVRLVRECSDLIYHVDVRFYPSRGRRYLTRTTRTRRD
jgi:divalent metal cation (Fe/Co/Zn/Cd) transporter